MKLIILTLLFAVANGFGGSNGPPPGHKHHPQQKPHPGHNARPSPRYYNDIPPHIIASPRPRSLPHPPPPSYRTLNPLSAGNFLPMPTNHRNERSEPPSPKQPQLVASASNTPVLVLKKDHSRPVLSSAVVAAAIAEKRAQQQHQQKQAAESQQKLHHDNNKPIPTVIMERPGSNNQQQPQHEEPEHEEKKDTSPSQQDPQSPKSNEKDHPHNNHHETSLEHDEMSEESDHPPPIPPSASAERRMFFDSVNQNGAIAHQVSGPQGPSNPPRHHHKNNNHGRVAAASSLQQQARAPPHHHQRPLPPQHHRHHDEEEDDEPIERITRSNVNPYSGVGGFEYPPPQGNYIAQGPTRVPVKYQQGVVGIKPHHGQGGHPGGHPGGKPRPYKQRIQQHQQQQGGSEEPLSEELEEEEEAQPDRLQELLATSKFTCGGKKDGYYADDSLNCEVFHYCQDGGKHSWLCPNGFAFHQIHLICVPPSSDNICKQSSNYHFVNEYLYKPVNEREAEGTNVSLKYADRYFPDGYNNGAGDVLLPYHDDEEDDDERPQQHHNRHQQQQHQSPYVSQQHARPRPQQHHPSQQHSSPPYNPYANLQAHHPQQQHHQRPQYAPQGGFVPSPQVHSQSPRPQQHHASQQQRLHQAYAQQRSGAAAAHQIMPQKPVSKHGSSMKPPHPHAAGHHGHAQSSSNNPNVFFSPESINIPLNQRRPIPNHPSHHPQIFRPSPQVAKGAGPTGKETRRKFEEDDEYEY